MDALTNIISLLRIEGHLYGRLEFTAPWAFEFTGGPGICLIVMRGTCFIEVERQVPLPLVGGDFVLLPEPERYILRSDTETPLRHIRTVISPDEFRRSRLITGGGGGAPVSVIAGGFTFATPGSAWLIKHLPPILHLSASGASASPWFQSTLQFIAAELSQNLLGASTIVDRLTEVLFVQALRTLIQSPSHDERPSWLRALADQQIGESLRLMHAEPGHPWTVPELASQVSMSRSAFAARFRELVGDTPLNHLTQWRMVRAASLMYEDRSSTLSEIAVAVGYESESAFGKAFRRIMGVSPGKYRQNYQLDTGAVLAEPADKSMPAPSTKRSSLRYD